jgi:anti-sigma regulatory factor (Ser/Thr protein kinase)
VSVETRCFANEVVELRRLSDWIRTFAREAELDENLSYHVDLCLDEAVTNIIRHGYDKGVRGTITVSLELIDDRLRVVVADAGREFNPLRHSPPAASAALEDLPVGGFGIHLMRSYADALEYRRDGDRNILTLYFRCGVEGSGSKSAQILDQQ